MLPSHAALRLYRHGTGNHADRDSETIQPPLSAAGNLAEIGRTRTGLALRWGRHHLRWGSVTVAETGVAHWKRTAVRRLLHRLPQPQADRTSVVGPDHAARVRAGAGLRGSQCTRRIEVRSDAGCGAEQG